MFQIDPNTPSTFQLNVATLPHPIATNGMNWNPPTNLPAMLQNCNPPALP